MRTAEVYFRRFVSVVLDGTAKEFYPAEQIRLNFSLIHTLLEAYPDCLYLRKPQEKTLYDAAF